MDTVVTEVRSTLTATVEEVHSTLIATATVEEVHSTLTAAATVETIHSAVVAAAVIHPAEVSHADHHLATAAEATQVEATVTAVVEGDKNN